jgi:hypothetical protein
MKRGVTAMGGHRRRRLDQNDPEDQILVVVVVVVAAVSMLERDCTNAGTAMGIRLGGGIVDACRP